MTLGSFNHNSAKISRSRYERIFGSFMIFLMLLAITTSSTLIRPARGDAAWWNLSWEFRKPIVINHANVTADLVDFPFLVDLTDADLAAKAKIGGDDIAFTDSSGQKLDHEIEYYNGTEGRLLAWVKLPLLSSTVDTTIYMYYGNPDALNQENTGSVWASDYMMVQHFNERYENGECRFWGMIAQTILPESVVLDQLINLPNSLKAMGAANPNGWGLGYYSGTEPIVNRGELAANTDPNFNLAAEELAASGANIGIGHVRKSASPPYNVPDPHPFNRTKMGKTWVFAHHGTISQAVLVQLIGPDYLAANTPEYGNDTSTYNDSELYFLYILECIEVNSGDVRNGLAQALTTLSAQSASYNMDFVFSDGTTLWAFRRGDSTHLVYYYYNSTSPQYSAVASQYPTSTQGDWVALNNYNLVEMNGTGAPFVITDIRGYAPIDHFDSTVNENDGVAKGGVVISSLGKINGGDKFDGVDDYVSVNDSSTLDGRGLWSQLTVEFWVKPDNANPTAQRILRKGPSSGTGVNSYQIGFQTTGSYLYFDVWAPGSAVSAYYEVQYGTILSTATWYNVVCVYEAGVGSKIYVNGVDVNATRVGTTGDPTKNVGGSVGQPLYIGARYHSTNGVTNFFNGTLDEMRISKVARSAGWTATSYKNQNDPTHFYGVGSEEVNLPTSMRVGPATTEAVLGTDCIVDIEVTSAVDLYAWEFQLNYNPAVLNLTSCYVVEGGLNEPAHAYYILTDTANGHLWWAVSTINPTLTGISYTQHAIFELHYHTISSGVSELGLYSTFMSDSSDNPIAHNVVNGSITVSGAIDLTVSGINLLDQGCSIYANDTCNAGDYYYPVEVTIQNLGTSPAPSFYVKLEAYWISGSLVEASVEESVTGLTPGTSTTINFTDCFRPLHTGYYRLTATVDSRNGISETDETNNALIFNTKYVTVVGDVNGDHVVNIVDGVIVSLAWGGNPGSPQWNIKADANHDGNIDILDGSKLGLHWGQTS